MMKRAMVVTDLDGTLFQRDRRASPENLRALEELGARQVLRVIATGRNLFSVRNALPPAFPVDYVLFSSGAGCIAWESQELLRAVSMNPAQVFRAFAVLAARGLDFMLHRPIPRDQHFRYYASGRSNPDFEARKALYAEFARPGDHLIPPKGKACQFLAVEPPDAEPSAYEGLASELAGLTVIRTTSPLDGRSRWIEIFSPRVSKAQAAAWLASRLSVARTGILAVGNDYNDLDLLAWASRGCLVGGSPQELARRFPVVSGGGDSDFAEAVSAWERGEL